MSDIISGTFNGTGADLYVGIGFIPDWVRVYNLENANENSVFWSIQMRSAEQLEGLQLSNSTTSPLTVGNGVSIYRGEDQFTTAQTAYIVCNVEDQRGSGSGNDVTTWTLDTSADKTGKFNAGVSTSYVGEGSRICIREDVSQAVKWATIMAMTNDGDADDEVTLSEAVKSGDVLFIGPMYDYSGVAANTPMPAGFKVSNTTINGSGELCFFEAGCYA